MAGVPAIQPISLFPDTPSPPESVHVIRRPIATHFDAKNLSIVFKGRSHRPLNTCCHREHHDAPPTIAQVYAEDR
ncbi:hypothetical protein A0H81_04674 [Grifola frondosa]|uniref:Uncharacterized protein n=1 Tax=Grifola frondosa TaxID=5627 RepID=A0A1C7MG00_GRIFR|nr:hypothetical protein A0H81_04674 [Grifola frondosa]